MKEILLYGAVYQWSVEEIINSINQVGNGGLCLRVNSPGGEVMSAYGLIAKYKEYSGSKKIKVDGQAASIACYMLFASTNNECLDVSRFLLHRAAYSSYIENDRELFNDTRKEELNKINGQLKALLESRCGADKFKKVLGVSMDEMFSLDSRIDIAFNAEQAKELGIIQTVNSITAQHKQELEALATKYSIAAFAPNVHVVVPTAGKDNNNDIKNKNNNKTMLAQDIKTQHPEAYNDIFQLGIKAEQGRVKAWMAWQNVAPEKVAKAIADGTQFDPVTDLSELSAMAAGKSSITALEGENAKPVTTPEKPAAEATLTKEAEAGFEEVNKILGFKG